MGRWVGWWAVAMAMACGPGSGSGDEGTGSGAGSDGASEGSGSVGSATASSASASATTTASSSGTEDSGGSSGGGCGPSPCDACGPGCVDGSECVDGQWSCHCVCDTQCPDNPESEFAHGSETEPIDCGALGAGDDLAAWQALHDCVVGQAAAQGAFWASWGSEDGTTRVGMAAAVAESYAGAYFDIFIGGDTIQYTCSGFAATPDCTVEPFAPCVTCLEMGEGQTSCVGPK